MRGEFDDGADAATRSRMCAEVAGEAVGDVERRDATPRSAMPSATRGSGRSRRARSARSVGGVERRAALERRERERRVAERARHPDVVAGARAAARERRAGGHLADDRHAQVARAARRVAADQRRRRARRASANRPRANAASHASSASGSAPASSAQRGSAPIAARSDRFTASVLWPSVSGSAPAKEVPALDQHVDRQHELAARASGATTRRVVADADAHRRVARRPREVARDQLELAVRSPEVASAGRPIGPRRSAGARAALAAQRRDLAARTLAASLSSTPLTYLWPSVPP